MQTRIENYFQILARLPLLTIASGEDIASLNIGFQKATYMLKNAHRIYIVGNGGSAAIASHMAEDYTKNGGIPMLAFNDAPMLTCFANDMGYENVFSSAIGYYAELNDVVIAISSSGRSQNILNAVKEANIKGCKVITFSGFKPSNPLREMGDINFYIPDENYGNVEICHLSLLHCMLDFICEDKK